MALKFGMGVQKKKNNIPSKKPPFGKSSSAFGQDDSDEEGSNQANLATSGDSKASKKSKLPLSQYGDLSSRQTHKKNTEAALEVDPSVYDYDAAYDAIHAKAAAKKAADRENAENQKAQYMENLLASAEVRKRDQMRAKEKMLQREREAEGDEFAEKEKFVTGAYEKHQEEVKKLEEEEKKKEEAEAKKRRKMGNQVFFRNLMDEQERNLKEAVAAAAYANKSGAPKLEPEETEKTDIQIAQEMNEKGANVVITDEGEIADKRQLLSAGLNIIAKPRPSNPKVSNVGQPTESKSVFQGKPSSQRAMRERQSRMMEAQLEQMTKRQADDDAEEQRKLEHAAKSKKTVTDIGSARERYLQRKREALAKKESGS